MEKKTSDVAMAVTYGIKVVVRGMAINLLTYNRIFTGSEKITIISIHLFCFSQRVEAENTMIWNIFVFFSLEGLIWKTFSFFRVCLCLVQDQWGDKEQQRSRLVFRFYTFRFCVSFDFVIFIFRRFGNKDLKTTRTMLVLWCSSSIKLEDILLCSS